MKKKIIKLISTIIFVASVVIVTMFAIKTPSDINSRAEEKTEDTQSNIEMSVVDKKNNITIYLFKDPGTDKEFLIFKDINGGIAVTER